MANNKLNFTKAVLENLPVPPAGKRSYYYDTKARGLGVSITGAGTKSFIVYRWVNEKPERVTLGRFPDLSIEQARGKAAEVNATIAKGENPNDKRRKDRAEITFGALFEEYLERHAKQNKSTWKEDKSQNERYLQHWAKCKISHISKNDVQKLHHEAGREGKLYTVHWQRRANTGSANSYSTCRRAGGNQIEDTCKNKRQKYLLHQTLRHQWR
jgi:hypothetical protein